MAKLFFRYGAMGSSKTANALMVEYNYRERGKQAIMAKPKTDTRDGENIIRHLPQTTAVRCKTGACVHAGRGLGGNAGK